MRTILITNDPAIAADAQKAGVTRIMVDLESHGKKERQAVRNTFISTHRKEDMANIRDVLTTSEFMVRINAMHSDSEQDIDDAVREGADIIMLPMITRMVQFDDFIRYLNGRAQALPLVETAYSMAHIAKIAAHPAVKDVFIGLNDLHLSLGLDFLFEPLALGLVDWMAANIREQGKPFGFGGMAMLGSGELPAELILAEHARLGSSCVILSSRFCKDIDITNAIGRRDRLSRALENIQVTYTKFSTRSVEQRETERVATNTKILSLAEKARTAS